MTPIQVKWGDETDADLDQVCFQSIATNIVMGALAQIRRWDLVKMDGEEIEDLRVESALIVEHLSLAGMLWAPASFEEFNKTYSALTTYLGQNLDEATE